MTIGLERHSTRGVGCSNSTSHAFSVCSMLHQYFLDGEKGWSEWIFGALLNCNIALGCSGDGIAMQQVNKIFLENKGGD